jgi:hypothetical protein
MLTLMLTSALLHKLRALCFAAAAWLDAPRADPPRGAVDPTDPRWNLPTRLAQLRRLAARGQACRRRCARRRWWLLVLVPWAGWNAAGCCLAPPEASLLGAREATLGLGWGWAGTGPFSPGRHCYSALSLTVILY